jgi:PAS domain S-box-containing protein
VGDVRDDERRGANFPPQLHAIPQECDVDALHDLAAEELRQLRECVNDLGSIITLAHQWGGGEPTAIVGNVLDALLKMLRLGFVCARLHDPKGGDPIEMTRIADSLQSASREIGQTIEAALGDTPATWLSRTRISVRDVDMFVASTLLGIDGEVGIVSAGSTRPDFPTHAERLVLDVAANQAVLGLQKTRRVRDGERNTRLLVDSIPGLVALLTATGEVEFVNRQIIEYTGRTLEELKRCGTDDTVHGEDLPGVIETVTRAISSGSAYEIVQRLRRSDGTYHWFQNNGFPLRDASGRIVRWCVLLTNIDERKRAEDERKRAETQLAGEKRLLEMVASGRSLTDVLNALCSFVEDTATNCHCGVYLIDWSGPTFQNAAAPTLPGSFNDPIHGLPVGCEIGPCARAACLKTQVIAADIESDPVWQGAPFRALALTNGLRSCWSTPIYSLAGRVLGTFAIYQRTPGSPTPLQQDLITQVTHIASIAIERAQSEAALKRSEAFLADGQRLRLTGSFSWCVATDEITWSEQLYRIYEIEIGTPVTLELIRTRVHPEDVSLIERMKMIDAARGDSDEFEWQYRLRMPDHSIKYLHAVGHAIRDQEGQLEYIAAVQDVTERRLSDDALASARSELAQVARATSLGVLTAAIAHEVNQPLSGIITNAGTCLRMLDANPPNLEGARETARRTIRDGNRASDVITRLRALFRNEELTLESLDLNEVTREVIALSLSDLQRHRVALQSQLADDLPAVTADRIQLQQVILNLLRNGSDAMVAVADRPRQLLISTEREGGDRVRLSVRDAGVGVDSESMNKLFDAFYTTKSDGMGIGLSVSRSIIEQHRGRLWAESNDGPGATFSFSIPAVQTSVAAARPR